MTCARVFAIRFTLLATAFAGLAPAAFADNRLYRHCHWVGSRPRLVCMTADPWSPEHMELDRREGRLFHEGGPIDAARKAKNLPQLHDAN